VRTPLLPSLLAVVAVAAAALVLAGLLMLAAEGGFCGGLP
jgi:hypothetical protein